MKKIIFIFLGFLHATSFAQVDYSNGNSNNFKKYSYITPQQQAKLDSKGTDIDYFSNSIINPKLIYDKNNNSKYKYLMQNSNSLNGCWDNAGKIYKLDPWLLMSIAKVESSFNKNAINKNKNNTYDLGMMQINSIWLPTLKRFGITKNDLLTPCTSVFVGAWIMSQNIRQFGYNMDGIGAYNSPKNIKIRRNYAKKVYVAYKEITHDLYYAKN